MSELLVYSWDGSLPDSMSFIGVSLNFQWSGDSTTMKTRFQLHFSVPLTGTDTGSVCIDSIGWYEGNHEWLFSSPSNFGGPYCFEFGVDATVPPEILDVPASLTTPLNIPFDLNLTVRSGRPGYNRGRPRSMNRANRWEPQNLSPIREI